MTYLPPDLLSDEGAVAEAILAGIADAIPDWQPSEGDVETAWAESAAMQIASIAALIKDEAEAAFVGFVEGVVGILRVPEQVASALSSWTVSRDSGLVIPAGTELVVRNLDGDPVAFATIEDVTVPAGSEQAVNVPVTAVEAGPAANGIVGAAESWTALDGVAGAALTTVSAGGADAEPLDAFRERAARRMRQLRIVAIEERDYAELPRDVPGVDRCLAVRLLDPADPPTPPDEPSSGGHVTVFPIDAEGEPVPAPVAAAVEALLAGGDRPVNVTVHVEEPDYTVVNVAVTVWLDPDVEEAAVVDAVEAAVADALSPAMWMRDPLAPGLWRKPTRDVERRVSAFDMAHVTDSVPGVAGVDACTVNGAAEVPLTGWAPLPRPGTVTVTVI